MPNQPFFGTKKAGAAAGTFVYEWMTVAETYTTAKHFGAGLIMKDLIPQVEGEGK